MLIVEGAEVFECSLLLVRGGWEGTARGPLPGPERGGRYGRAGSARGRTPLDAMVKLRRALRERGARA